MRISVDLDDKEIKILKKRAKENLLTIREQVGDIIRRSCVSSSRKKTRRPIKCDDHLVGIFSRQKSGRKRKKK